MTKASGALIELQRLVSELVANAGELVLTAIEDRPVAVDAIAIDALADAVTEFDGRAREAAAAMVPTMAAGRDLPMDVVVTALLAAESAIDKATDAYWTGVVDRALVGQLHAVARDHGAECRAWARSAVDAADRCASVLRTTRAALVPAWEELARRAGLLHHGPITTVA